MYGIEVTNQSGRIVLNSNDPVLQFVAKGTVSLDDFFGDSAASVVCNETGSQSSTVYIDCNRKTMPEPEEGEFYFWEVPDGKRVHTFRRADVYEVYSDAASLRWVRCKFANYITPRPTGNYGIEIFDGSGGLIYTSNAILLTSTGTLSGNTGGIWVAPEGDFIRKDDRGRPCIKGVHRSGSTLTPQGWTTCSQYIAVEGYPYDGQRIRGLVADINWTAI